MLSRTVIDILSGGKVREGISMEQMGAAQEIEHVWYMKVADHGQFANAPKSEHQIQCEYPIVNSEGNRTGVLRTRDINQGECYELTIKSKNDAAGIHEVTLESMREAHEAVKAISTRIFHKTRYSYPVVVTHDGKDIDLMWEVDVYVLADGTLYPWVKIDLEVPAEGITPPLVPFIYEECFMMTDDVEGEQRLIADTLYSSANRAIQQ